MWKACGKSLYLRVSTKNFLESRTILLLENASSRNLTEMVLEECSLQIVSDTVAARLDDDRRLLYGL